MANTPYKLIPYKLNITNPDNAVLQKHLQSGKVWAGPNGDYYTGDKYVAFMFNNPMQKVMDKIDAASAKTIAEKKKAAYGGDCPNGAKPCDLLEDNVYHGQEDPGDLYYTKAHVDMDSFVVTCGLEEGTIEHFGLDYIRVLASFGGTIPLLPKYSEMEALVDKVSKWIDVEPGEHLEVATEEGQPIKYKVVTTDNTQLPAGLHADSDYYVDGECTGGEHEEVKFKRKEKKLKSKVKKILKLAGPGGVIVGTVKYDHPTVQKALKSGVAHINNDEPDIIVVAKNQTVKYLLKVAGGAFKKPYKPQPMDLPIPGVSYILADSGGLWLWPWALKLHWVKLLFKKGQAWISNDKVFAVAPAHHQALLALAKMGETSVHGTIKELESMGPAPKSGYEQITKKIMAEAQSNMTTVEAVELAATEWWLLPDMTPFEVVRFQLYEDKMCMPSKLYGKCLHIVFGRYVGMMEGASPELKTEFEGMAGPVGAASVAEAAAWLAGKMMPVENQILQGVGEQVVMDLEELTLKDMLNEQLDKQILKDYAAGDVKSTLQNQKPVAAKFTYEKPKTVHHDGSGVFAGIEVVVDKNLPPGTIQFINPTIDMVTSGGLVTKVKSSKTIKMVSPDMEEKSK